MMYSYRMMSTRNLTKGNVVYQQHRLCSDGQEKDRKFILPVALITGRHIYEWLRG